MRPQGGPVEAGGGHGAQNRRYLGDFRDGTGLNSVRNKNRRSEVAQRRWVGVEGLKAVISTVPRDGKALNRLGCQRQALTRTRVYLLSLSPVS